MQRVKPINTSINYIQLYCLEEPPRISPVGDGPTGPYAVRAGDQKVKRGKIFHGQKPPRISPVGDGPTDPVNAGDQKVKKGKISYAKSPQVANILPLFVDSIINYLHTVLLLK